MRKLLKDVYFSDHRYVLLYIHYFFFQTAVAAAYVFTGAYFLQLGMPLHFVLLFYGLEFGLRGLLCPFGVWYLNKVNLLPALFTAAGLTVLFFIGVSFSSENLYIGFFSLILYAMANAILYPLYDVLEAVYVDHDHHRGRQITLSQVSKSMGRALGAGLVGFILHHYGFSFVVIFVALTLLCALVPFFWLHKTMRYIRGIKPRDVYRFTLLSDEFRPFRIGFFGYQFVIIVNAVMVPIFIYTIVGEMDNLGYLIAAVLVVEQIVSLVTGHYIDHLGAAQALRRSLPVYAAVMLAYITFAKSALTIFFTETCNRMMFNMTTGAFFTGMHIKARKQFPERVLLFGAGSQMTLCLCELIVLPCYALLAYFIGINVFYVSCVASVFGLAIVVRFFSKHHH